MNHIDNCYTRKVLINDVFNNKKNTIKCEKSYHRIKIKRQNPEISPKACGDYPYPMLFVISYLEKY